MKHKKYTVEELRAYYDDACAIADAMDRGGPAWEELSRLYTLKSTPMIENLLEGSGTFSEESIMICMLHIVSEPRWSFEEALEKG